MLKCFNPITNLKNNKFNSSQPLKIAYRVFFEARKRGKIYEKDLRLAKELEVIYYSLLKENVNIQI